jgi:roadblock/LC7 domain-containing protein
MEVFLVAVTERTNRIANTTQEMIEAQRQSYETLTDGFIEFHKRNVRFFQNWMTGGADYLRKQAQHNQRTAEAFAESARAQQEGLRKLGEDWIGLYEDAASASVSYVREGVQNAQEATQEGSWKKAWDELDHRRNPEGRFGPGEIWDESAHTRDTEGQFT